MDEKERLEQLKAEDLYGVLQGRETSYGPRLDKDEVAAFEAGWEAAKAYCASKFINALQQQM